MDGAQLRRLAKDLPVVVAGVQREMRVRVDEPGQQGRVAEIDDLGAGRHVDALADRGDMSTADEHRHSSAHFADAVEEASGAQGDDRLRRGSSEQCGEKGSER